MGKLFNFKDFDTEVVSKQTIETKLENSDIPNINEEYEYNIQVAIENFQKASNELFIVNDIRTSLESKKLASVEYFTSVENYSLFMKSIANNLGIKTKIPSMEDFKNPYGTKASHQFMMEGFKEFIRSIWEKIKSFFKDFFKRIMLFFKRLANANLQMEEYEEYIENLMRNVRNSDKSKVVPVKVDSKLPSLLTDLGMSELNVNYLVTIGQQKLVNLVDLSNVMIEKAIPNLISNINNTTSKIKSTYNKNYKPLPDEASEFTSNQRDAYISSLKNIFSYNVGLKSLPEKVYNDVMYVFDSNQLKEENSEFLSLIEDRNKFTSLPKKYNLYLIISNFEVSDGQKSNRTSRIFISPNYEINTNAQNFMYTMSDKNNLLKFYDFYKTFSKGIKIDRIVNQIDKIYTTVSTMINDLEKPFIAALETMNWDRSDNVPYVDLGVPDNRPDLQTGPIKISNTPFNEYNEAVDREQSHQQAEHNKSIDQLREATKNEIKEFQKFVFNYMNTLQFFIKEFSTSIIGSYQECRYELIKYIYKSAKQF